MASTLATPPELATLGQQKLRSLLDPGGTGAVDLSPGSRNDVAISTNVAMYTRLFQYVADRLTARSLSTATGDDLDVLVTDLYQDSRKAANAATGSINLQRTGTAQTLIPYGSQFAVPATSTTPGVAFFCMQDTPVAAGVLTTAVPLQCVQTDVVGNVQAALITQIKDPLPDTTWSIASVSATQYFAGGAPEESDDEFRARIQQSAFDDSKRRGTLTAIKTGALRVPGVVNVTAVEPNDGTVLVFCGDSAYNLSSTMQTGVQVELEDWRAFGVPAIVRPYDVITVTVVATVYMQRALSNYNAQGGTGSVQAQAVANVISYFTNRQRPDEFFGSSIVAAMTAAHPEVQQVVINSLSVSGGPTPDGTNSVRRSSDALYGSVQTMLRYVVSTASLQVNVAPPLTN